MELPDTWRSLIDANGWSGAVEGDTVVIDAGVDERVRVDLTQQLQPTRLRLITSGSDVQLVFDTDANFDSIVIEFLGARSGRRIRLSNSAPHTLRILGVPAQPLAPWDPCVLLLDQTDLANLRVEGLGVEVQAHSVESLVLVNAGAHLNGSRGRAVQIEGECVLSAMGIDQLSATPSSRLSIWSANTDGPDFPLEQLETGSTVRVFGGRRVVTGGLPKDCVVDLDNGLIQINAEADSPVFRGWGGVGIGERSRLANPRFESMSDDEPEKSLVLRVRSGTASQATGTVDVLDLAGEASIAGKADGSFVVRKVQLNNEAMPVAELEGVSSYELRAIDLQVIERTCRRFRPWFEPRAGDRARRENEMTHSHGPAADSITRARGAEYWARMERLLTEQRAGGETLSHAREANLRARHRAAHPWTREWWVLGLYSLIGYGERIVRPLAIYAALCLAGFATLWLFDAADAVAGWRLLGYLLASPATLLRVEAAVPPNSPGVLDSAVFGVLKALGVALLASSLLAARRIGKGS